MNPAAHELLETSEALRTKAAEIDQHGLFAKMCKDQHLKSILMKHQRQMLNAYQQGINFMQGRGAYISHTAPSFQTENVSTGMSDQAQATMVPMPNAPTLSDSTIATLALNVHKSGSMMGMLWANECVDPNLRMYHVNGANLCQEMAYEIWTWMNQHGYYQPPTFSNQQMTQMSGMFQPMGTMGMQNMGTMPSMGNMGNAPYGQHQGSSSAMHQMNQPNQGNLQ